MLGMGAMMGAVLQAPLAALMALMELTRNPNIILPGMLIITTASLVTSEAFGKKSLFLTILKNQGLSYQNSPRSEEHTSELQSRPHLVCRLLLEKKKQHK